MDIICLKSDQPAAAKAYVIQYVSLILIILTFIIGSFASRKLLGGSRAIPRPGVTVTKETEMVDHEDRRTWLTSTVTYQDLFGPSDGQVNIEKVIALAEFIRNHDVDLEIVITRQGVSDDAVGKAVALWEALSRESISGKYYQILVHNTLQPEGNPDQAVVKFYNHPGDGG